MLKKSKLSAQMACAAMFPSLERPGYQQEPLCGLESRAEYPMARWLEI